MTPRGYAPFVGIHHVQLLAPPGSEAVARQFYGDLLGLAEIGRPVDPPAQGGLCFQCGEQELHIVFQGDGRPACAAHVSLQMVNATTLGALQVKLELEGLDVQSDDSLDRYRRFLVCDPFGNCLEFICPRY